MNRSLDVLKKIYKPYRLTILGKATILNTTSGDFVVKESNDKNIKELFSYLNSRSFHNFPNLIDGNRNDVNVYEYVSGVVMPLEQKALDLIDIISNLHNKTTFYKMVTEDDFKKIYDNIKSNIVYLENYYNNLYEEIKKENYMSPSHYSLIRNIYKIFEALEFSSKELDNWFNLVKDQTKKRVCLIHNKLSLDHFIKSESEYLISWEEYRTDSPIMDLVKFYHQEYFNINFSVILSRYLEKVNLSDDEKKLFFILISIPQEISFTNNEFKDCEIVRKSLDYLFITENLMRPYYTIQEKD